MAIKVKTSSTNFEEDSRVDTNSEPVSQPLEDDVEILKRKLYIDPVLGCFNRAKFEDDITHIDGDYTYFSIDGNNLKYINDNFSHEAGDQLLKSVAISGMSVWNDNFYRFGGDEFGAILPFKQDEFICTEQMNKFKELLGREDANHPDYPIAASIGYAYGNSSQPFKNTIDAADEMMMQDKAIYKKQHPELDMRKARITKDTLKEAAEEGTLADALKEYREERYKDKPVTADEVFSQPQEITEDIEFETVSELDSKPERKPRIVYSDSTDIVPQVNEDMGSFNLSASEEAYQENEFNNKVQPILQETTQKVVKEAIKVHNDKLKLEVSEVLEDEVSYRLSRYEKRRRRRDFKEKVASITKLFCIALVVIIILANGQLRTRFAVLAKDLGDMVSSLIKGEETSSNKFVEDLLRDMGSELNEMNTSYGGFDIYLNGETHHFDNVEEFEDKADELGIYLDETDKYFEDNYVSEEELAEILKYKYEELTDKPIEE